MKFYSFYHCNLMFSSIDINLRREVINKCYWPLLKLAKKGYKISLESSAITLEYINEIDSDWIDELAHLIKVEKIEFIGCGYSQIIAPIVPYEVNKRNILEGIKVYSSLLNYKPEIYLINEMAFSIDLISIYGEFGIKNVILEWNNFYKYSLSISKELSFKPLRIKDKEQNSINIIWADSICFQKFQRCIHGEFEKEEFINYIKKRINQCVKQFIPLYSSDAEIFDFRPGRFKTENSLVGHEWGKIEELYSELSVLAEFVFINDIIKNCQDEIPEILFSSILPIQVKKQEKYNIYRWAIGGRNNLKLNADCYKLYKYFQSVSNNDEKDWRRLLFYWSSDFRTHISLPRFVELNKLLSNEEGILKYQTENVRQSTFDKKIVLIQNPKSYTINTNKYEIKLNRKKGLTIQSFILSGESKKSVIGEIEHGTYDDIAFSNDYFSGYAICYDNSRKQHTHLFDRKETIEHFEDRIVIKADNNCNNKFHISDEMTAFQDYFEIKRKITILDDCIDIIHPFTFTFLPNKQLRLMSYNICCGGRSPQNYSLLSLANSTQQSKYLTISAINGISPTDGKLILTDEHGDEQLNFQMDNCESPLMYNFIFEENVGLGEEKLPFCWLVMSAQEINDTFKGNTERKNTFESKIKIY